LNSASSPQAARLTNLAGRGSWTPGQQHSLTPSLVVFCGSVAEGDAHRIRQGIEARLGFGFPSKAVGWFRLKTAKELSRQRVTEVVTPLLRQELWEALLADGHIAEMPREALPLCVVVICDLKEPEDEILPLLKKVLAVLRHVLKGRAQFSPILIALGDGDLQAESVKGYWPLLGLQNLTRDGAAVTRERLLQTCETVVVSLLNSELMQALSHVLAADADSHNWLWVGASAVSVDARAMREYQRLLILRDLVAPTISGELTPSQRGSISSMMEGQARQYREALLNKAMSVASDFEWEHCRPDGDGEGTELDTFELRREGELWKTVSSRDGRLAGTLEQHLTHLRDALVENLAETASDQHGRFLSLLGLFLDRGAASPVSGEGTDINEEEGQSGLPAVEWALDRAVVESKRHADIYHDGADVIAYQNLLGGFLASVAEGVDAKRLGELAKYLRFERSIASPLGLSLLLIPAWPLLAGIVARVLQWSDERATLASAALLAGVGVVEFIWWKRKAQQRMAKLEGDLMEMVARAVLGAVAKVLRDYRLLVAKRLQGALRDVRRVHDLLTELDRDAQVQSAKMAKDLPTGDGDRGGVYTLMPLHRCLEWKDQALREADAADTRYESLATCLAMDYLFPLLRHRLAPRMAVKRFEDAAEELTEGSFRSDVLEAQQQTELDATLGEGRWWRWLHERAQPLGGAGQRASMSFTVMVLGGEAATIGGFGEVSEYWGEDWIVAGSSQPHEMICVRGVLGSE
jgi:hypothetical protein